MRMSRGIVATVASALVAGIACTQAGPAAAAPTAPPRRLS